MSAVHLLLSHVAKFMKVAAHEHFGLGVFAFDAAHVVAAGGWGVNIGHEGKCSKRMPPLPLNPSANLWLSYLFKPLPGSLFVPLK
jgi:hypothetical protein